MIDIDVFERAKTLLQKCIDADVTVATVESCTGGLVAASLTEVAGSSAVVDRGFVTYTNEAKNELVGVPMHLFEEVGAVSEEVAWAMAEGAQRKSGADIAVSITGVAGPGGGTDAKPVGLVHFASCRWDGKLTVYHEVFSGDREAVREAAVLQAMQMIEDALFAAPGA